MGKIKESTTRLFLYISILFLVIVGFATAILPADAPEKTVGYITMGINVVSIICISVYINYKYKKEQEEKEKEPKNKILDFIESFKK